MSSYGGFYGGGTPLRPTRSPALRNYLDRKRAMQPQQSPQTPMPSTPGRIQTPTMQTSGTPWQGQNYQNQMQNYPSWMKPQGSGGVPNESDPYQKTGEMVQGLGQDQNERYTNLSNALYSVPDFKGRHEMNRMLLSQYAMLMDSMNRQPQVDLSGYSEVADQYGNQRERLMNDLSAGGFSGSGVMAGAMANMAGSQARAQGSFVRDALEQRRRENLAREQDFLNKVYGTQMRGLGREWDQQDEPGFLQDALGVVGGIAGTALGGGGFNPLGFLGKKQQPKESDYGFGQVPMNVEDEPWWGGV